MNERLSNLAAAVLLFGVLFLVLLWLVEKLLVIVIKTRRGRSWDSNLLIILSFATMFVIRVILGFFGAFFFCIVYFSSGKKHPHEELHDQMRMMSYSAMFVAGGTYQWWFHYPYKFQVIAMTVFVVFIEYMNKKVAPSIEWSVASTCVVLFFNAFATMIHVLSCHITRELQQDRFHLE